jgi:hypothetical protein
MIPECFFVGLLYERIEKSKELGRFICQAFYLTMSQVWVQLVQELMHDGPLIKLARVENRIVGQAIARHMAHPLVGTGDLTPSDSKRSSWGETKPLLPFCQELLVNHRRQLYLPLSRIKVGPAVAGPQFLRLNYNLSLYFFQLFLFYYLLGL